MLLAFQLPVLNKKNVHKMFCILDGSVFSVYDDMLMRAAISTAYFGFLRCGEFTSYTNAFDPEANVCLGDVIINFDEAFIILKSSKTDPFRYGLKIHYFRVECIFCAVEALGRFKHVRIRFAKDLATPFFLFQDFTHLTRSKFLSMLQIVCQKAGLESYGFKGHSFRIGAATTAAAKGIEDHLIQNLGRWKSDCYKTYVRVQPSSIKTAQQKMATI